MTGKYLKKMIDRYGLWRTTQGLLASCVSILLITIIVQVLIPLSLPDPDNKAIVSELRATENIPQLLDNKNNDKQAKDERIAYRAGLFKAASGLQDKPLANKTIERIKNQLKLQCVMEMNGQPVAYINIQGVGLKKCCIGNSVNDLFTVLNINKQNKSVDISIVDHKVTLTL